MSMIEKFTIGEAPARDAVSVVNTNRQALENLKLARLSLRNTQPSTVLNSLDVARKAVDTAIADMEAVVRLSAGGVL